jgi:regulator of telomere elongation helicase 1
MSSVPSALAPVWQYNGVEIRFPFSPYPSQKAFTENVLDCVVNGKHGILESPTGTGKTMALLAAAVAWTEHRRRIPTASVLATSMPKMPLEATSFASGRSSSLVIYSSRTHSQLVQVMTQLKRCLNASPTTPSVKAVVLGSRDQLCINPKAADKESSEKVKLCNVLTRSRQCEFYNNFQAVSADQMSSRSDVTEAICDIEDLVQKSRQRKICPYYASRDIASRADLIFLPYNYLLDASVRASLAIDLRDSVIIFDEAHNIMSTCEDATSYSFEVQDVALALHETDVIIQFLDSKIDIDFGGKDSAEVQVEDACIVKEALANLEDVLAAKIKNGDLRCDQAYPGDSVLNLLTASGIDFSRQLWLRTVMTNMTDLLAVLNSMTGGRESGKGLNSLSRVIQFVYSESSVEWTREHLRSYFRMYVERSTRHKDNVIFNVWCFNPAYAMRSLLSCGVRSMILTSGTLKPMSAIKSELGVTFDVTFVGPHVIGQSQVCAWTVPKSQDGTDLISTYGKVSPRISKATASFYNFPPLASRRKSQSRSIPGCSWTKFD